MRVISILVVSLIVGCRGAEPEASAERQDAPAQDAPTKVDAPEKADVPAKADAPTEHPEVEPPAPTEPPKPAEPPAPAADELPDLTWWCACYSETTATGPQKLMSCWTHKAECLELERVARVGSPTVVAGSLVTRCRRAHGDPPDNVGHAADWQQPAGPLTRQNRKGCMIPEDLPVVVVKRPKREPPPSPDPQPEKLEGLAAEYRAKGASRGGEYERRQAWGWHKVDYKQRIIEAAEGDEAALAVILGLELDGAGGEVHALNLETLLLGFGDEAFAKVLAAQPRKTIVSVLETLDWAVQTIEPTDPRHYRKTHRKTYALESRRKAPDPATLVRVWWCACTKRDGASVTSCRERVEPCVAVERAATAVGWTELEKTCRHVLAVHPGDELGDRESWRAATDGGWERDGECVLSGEPGTPTRRRGSGPEPRLLTALAELYAAGSDEDPLPKQARRWYRIDYRALVAKAVAGDDAAAGTLLGLELDGEVSNIHASTVDSLMRGYGDERFAALLAGLPRKTRKRALWVLDVLDGPVEQAPHYRHVYPLTFAAGDHELHRDE